MTRRFRIALLAALAVSFGAGAETASACISVHVGAYPESAHAGDVVRYSVSNLESGAHYTISFNGGVIATGVKGDAAVSGTFVMPDLGSARRTVALGLTFDHSEIDGSQGVDTKLLTYEPTAVAPPPPPAPAPPPPPATQPRHAVVRFAPLIRPRPRGHVEPRTTRRSRQPQPVRSARGPARSTTPVRTLVSHPARANSIPTQVGLRRHQTRAGGLRVEVATPRLVEPRTITEEAPRPATARGWNRGWLVLALTGLLLLGLSAASGWLRLRRRVGPVPDDQAATAGLEIEAELQEMIAEERAKSEVSPRS